MTNKFTKRKAYSIIPSISLSFGHTVITNHRWTDYLAADHPLTKPNQIRLAPGALAPRRDLPQILLEIEVGQLVVNEVSNVPGQVIVAVDQRHLGEDLAYGLQSLLGRCQVCSLAIGWSWPNPSDPAPDRQYDHACCPDTALAATLQRNYHG